MLFRIRKPKNPDLPSKAIQATSGSIMALRNSRDHQTHYAACPEIPGSVSDLQLAGTNIMMAAIEARGFRVSGCLGLRVL